MTLIQFSAGKRTQKFSACPPPAEGSWSPLNENSGELGPQSGPKMGPFWGPLLATRHNDENDAPALTGASFCPSRGLPFATPFSLPFRGPLSETLKSKRPVLKKKILAHLAQFRAKTGSGKSVHKFPRLIFWPNPQESCYYYRISPGRSSKTSTPIKTIMY